MLAHEKLLLAGDELVCRQLALHTAHAWMVIDRVIHRIVRVKDGRSGSLGESQHWF